MSAVLADEMNWELSFIQVGAYQTTYGRIFH
jgi:hypothetical protein